MFTTRGMKIIEGLFIGWVVIVSLFWIGSQPESAPQQAALAGQTLVLLCIPYCIVSVLQRSWAARRSREQPPETLLELNKPLRQR